MFFSSHDPQPNRQLITDAGLDIQVDELVTMQEPEGDATFQWVIATNPSRSRSSYTAAPDDPTKIKFSCPSGSSSGQECGSH